MKIVHLISGLRMGGAERILFDLAASLKAAGFDQTVIYFHEGPFAKALKQIGIPTIQITAPGGAANPVWWWRLGKAVRQLAPDLIHASLWLANLAGRLIGRLLKVPVLCALHNNHDQNGLMRNSIDVATLWAADELVAVSQGIVRTMGGYRFFPTKRVRVIPNGIPVGLTYAVAKDNAAHMNRLKERTFIFGSVGRFVPLKRYDFLIAVFAQVHQRLPATHLVLVGAGPLEQAIRDQIHALQLDEAVTLIIGQPAGGYYPFFDCFIQPSRKEGISIALLEAMATGIACIVTNQEPVHDVITDHKDGLLMPADDRAGLVDAMCHLVTNPATRQQLGKNAKNTVTQRFTLERMVDEYQRLYRLMVRQQS